MAELSRKIRRQQMARAAARRLLKLVILINICAVLAVLWHLKHTLAFAALSVITFFGFLYGNIMNIRRFIPGLDSRQGLTRFLFAVIYIIAAMVIIVRAS